MGRPTLRHLLVLTLALLLAGLSCDRSKSPGSTGAGRRVASLVPAATDMLIAMGARDHLVAVSNFESSAAVKDLPRVGDYQTTDWETLARLRPDAMVIQVAPDRVPPGLRQRADELKIELVNVKIDRLEDVFDTMQRLGAVAGERDKGRDAVRDLRARFDKLRDQCAAKPPVRVLIVRDENGQEVIGPDNFLDDVLRAINMTNAGKELGKPYPTVDRERLIALAPEAVIVLLPDAKPQSLETARRFWAALPSIPAVAHNRVSIISDGYALVPGARLADLAQQINDRVRPPPATTPPGTGPATRPAP
jgi:iron complex transport system substrate-binding protein